jgi:hypothetical protein
MLSRPVINASIVLMYDPLAHESYVQQYARDADFKYVYMSLIHDNQQLDYHVHDNFFISS